MTQHQGPRQRRRYNRTGLVLSVWQLSVLSLPFRALRSPRGPGFQPGLQNIFAYELRRFWHRIHEPERLLYFLQRLRRLWRR